jgi:excisionase family DNA binding protein
MIRVGMIQARQLREKASMGIRLLSVGQAAGELHVSPSTVRNWVDKGYISAFRLPSGVRRIPQDEVTRLVNEYFAFAAPVEGDDESSLVLAPEEESGEWGTPVESTGSSDQQSSAETAPDQSIAL